MVEPPVLKNMLVKMGSSSPIFVVKKENIWNHHLVTSFFTWKQKGAQIPNNFCWVDSWHEVFTKGLQFRTTVCNRQQNMQHTKVPSIDVCVCVCACIFQEFLYASLRVVLWLFIYIYCINWAKFTKRQKKPLRPSSNSINLQLLPHLHICWKPAPMILTPAPR